MLINIEDLLELKLVDFINITKRYNLQVSLVENEDKNTLDILRDIMTKIENKRPKEYTLDEACKLLKVETKDIKYWCVRLRILLNIDNVSLFTTFTERDIENLKIIRYFYIEKQYTMNEILRCLKG